MCNQTMVSDSRAKTGRLAPNRTHDTVLQRLIQALLGRLWYVHPPVHLTITLTSALVIPTLRTAAKPSTDRLELRNVFANGRRYYFNSHTRGFLMTTNAKRSWRYAHRTSAITVMTGIILPDPLGSHLILESRIKLTYLLDVLLIPLFMTSLIVAMPWHPLLIVCSTVALFGLSWLGHRYSATLEAYEMLFFVEKSFEELMPEAPPVIEKEGAHVRIDPQRDFASAWQHFYEDVVQHDTQRED